MYKLKRKFLLFLIPLFLVQLVIYVIPICLTFYNAFRNTVLPGAVGFTLLNFKAISATVGPVIGKTLIWTMGSIIPSMLIGLAAALVFNRDFRGKKICISICLLPYTIPLIIVAACWYLIYQPNFGYLNVLLKELGFISESVQFLAKDTALPAVIIARVWRSVPYVFISYYAALKAIPADLYEAASVDGASGWQKLLYVTLPQLRSITMTTGIILTVWTFMVFDIIFSMTGGGPANATQILPLQIYQELILKYNVGTASALSLVAIFVLSILTVVYWRIMMKGSD